MSEENVEMVRSIYEAWNAGNLEGFLANMGPAIEIDYTAGAFPGLHRSYAGHEGVRRYWQDLHGPWSSLKMEVEDVRANENLVATVFTFEGKGREGIVVRRRLGNVVTIEDGLVTRFAAYGDPGAALAAAGLSE